MKPRFKKPTYKDLIDLAILVREGEVNHAEIANMVAMANIIIDRLYDGGDIMVPSVSELIDGDFGHLEDGPIEDE